MKKPKFIRLRLLLGLTPGKSRRRGVAIITVLAVVSLMTVLIISFFQMAQTAKTTAIGTVEMQRVVTLKDVITNYVTAHIREATTLPGGGSTQTLWTSQPGAIRTYHGSNPELNRLYKLYSSDKMMIDGIVRDKSGDLMNEIDNDIESKWDDYPDMYVDLNRPVRSSLAEKDSDSPMQIKQRLIFPIADPSRYNGQDSAVTENTEGFSFGEHNLASKPVNGVDSQTGQLSMPVRWIYLLEDGTSGTVDKENKFVALSKDGAEPSKENPIVSRIAWWTDDESCKINVNTASIPVPWDTPRTTSTEDLWYAQHQPVSGECQHYPGHPAQTDLSAVFFPGFRYVPDATVFPVGENMKPLPDNYAQLLWNICPFITETGGSGGGKNKVNILAASPVPLDIDDHLYATFDELYFKTKRAEKNLNRARESVSKEDQSGKLFERLQGSQFFLTTRSNSPELTSWGTPKVCMFPMNEQVVAEVGKASGAVNPQVGAFEVTMATNCTLGAVAGRVGKAFYFQRATNADSRHNNFYNNVGGRNARLFKYLKKLTVGTPPGYPEVTASYFNTFAKKYPGPAGTNGDINKDFDSSDRTQILLSILDMMRSSNMAPGYLASGSSYDNGNGQVSGICGCNTIKPADVQRGHTLALAFDPNKKTYSPKGSGRTYGAAEFIFFANVIGYKKSADAPVVGTEIPPENPEMREIWNRPKGPVSLVQVGVLINSFSPRQGWAPLYSESGINLSTDLPHSTNPTNDPRTDAPPNRRVEAPFRFVEASPAKPFYLCTGTGIDGVSTANQQSPNGASPTPTGGDPPMPLPVGFVPWAGTGGLRVSATRSVATFDTFAYEGTGAGAPNTINVQLQWQQGKMLRVFVYDGPPSNFNTIQAVELDAGLGSIRLVADYTGKSMHTLMQESMTRPADSFPGPAIKMQMASFVVPHGDYRLTTTPLRVERGIYVRHSGDGHCAVEPLINGLNITYHGTGNSYKPQDPKQGLLAADGIPIMKPDYAPHFAPVDMADLCVANLGTQPTAAVLGVASSSPDQLRLLRMAHGRRDDRLLTGSQVPNRGSSDPIETGDFDNGVGLCPDGPYMNQPDDGDARDVSYPYYKTLDKKSQVNPAAFSPNRVFRSAVDFGSVPSGLQCRVPWQTLRFRPDPGMGKGGNMLLALSDQPKKPDGFQHFFPFSNYCGPKDHLLLDMLWMPIVEPWSISEGFATKGLINLNQQIFPFTYIKRTTALHALLRSERMMAIHDGKANDYKDGSKFPHQYAFRHWINAKETLKQLTDFRWKGQDAEGFTLPFNSFRSASEICELWLVPEKNSGGMGENVDWTLKHIIEKFWEVHRLTGDNMRERPYANLYPRVTVRSNVYKVHMIAQTLKKASTNEPGTFVSVQKEDMDPDLVTAEWRGSALVERVINPNEPELQTFDYAPEDNEAITDQMTSVVFPPKLDNFYTYRVTEVKQFTE